MSTKTLAKIAEYFGVSIDYLLGAETESSGAPDRQRPVTDDDIKAAFWGGDRDLSPEDIDSLFEDAKEYIAFKTRQRKRGK